jgi:phytoene synthase
MSLQACAETVRKGDPDRFLATMAAPPEAREKLFPLYAFNVEVARAPWVTVEPMIAEMRLQWWRDVLEEIGTAKPPRKHEVVDPLSHILRPSDAKVLDRLVQARRWDIYKEPFENEQHFREFIDATSGGLLRVAVRILGGNVPDDALENLGFSSGLANWFLAIPALSAAGRIPMVDGRPAVVQLLAQDGLERLGKFNAQVKSKSHPAFLATWRAHWILKTAARYPERVQAGQLVQPEFHRRASLLWRSFGR